MTCEVPTTNQGFLISNRLGDFFLMYPEQRSKYEGLFFRHNNEVYKTITSLRVNGKRGRLISIHPGKSATVQFEKEIKNIYFTQDHAIVSEGTTEIILDCKHIYDNDEWGRNYIITKERDNVIIHFTKEKCDFYVVLHAKNIEFKEKKTWEEHYYSLDEERKDVPTKRFVFFAGIIQAKQWSVGFGVTLQEARRAAKKSLKQTCSLDIKNIVPEYTESVTSAAHALLSFVNNNAISAGYPWFYQHWARDELISLGGLFVLEKERIIKKIVWKYLKEISDSIFVTHGSTKLRSIDALGWLWYRVQQHLATNKVSLKEKEFIKNKLNLSIKILEKRMQHGVVIAEEKETWMDTSWKEDSRQGACIEVQAMLLFMYALRKELTGEEKEIEFRKVVREQFYKHDYLYDMVTSNLKRPNVFIAAYFYPDLLSHEEWEKCFDILLKALWLPWGGLATIDKKHHLYTNNYTGINNKSYHRGDSWYWINNLVAIVLFRTNKKKYNKEIKKILEASTKDIMQLGIAGFASELSSAKEQQAQGCPAQAWSNAMYLELIKELF